MQRHGLARLGRLSSGRFCAGASRSSGLRQPRGQPGGMARQARLLSGEPGKAKDKQEEQKQQEQDKQQETKAAAEDMAKEAEEAARKAQDTAKEFFSELGSQFGVNKGGPADKSKPSLAERLRGVRETAASKLQDTFSKDERSWEDAFKAVFGIKPERKKREAAAAAAAAAESGAEGGAEAAAAEWFEAVDKETGDRYYYNKAGETVWEKPEGKIIRDADEEAHAWAEHEKTPEPSFLELKIAELGKEIGQLEEERDAAMAASEVAKFKELNKRIKELRKEIERASEQAFSTAVVHVEEKKGAWEKFNERLQEAPILRSILGIGDSETVRKARDAAHDAREALETSQNPLVYRMYSVYDSMFAETEMGAAIKEFRKMDPEFTIEEFMDELEEDIAPTVVKAFLRGDSPLLNEYCTESAAAVVNAAIKDRKAAGRRSNETILSIGDMHLVAAKVVDKLGPLMVVQFMVQQINCLYDMKGNVVEGKEDEVVGVVYIFAITREYDEEAAEYKWKIIEFSIGHVTPYI